MGGGRECWGWGWWWSENRQLMMWMSGVSCILQFGVEDENIQVMQMVRWRLGVSLRSNYRRLPGGTADIHGNPDANPGGHDTQR